MNFLRQICRGAEYLHSRNIIHLDLKVDTESYGKEKEREDTHKKGVFFLKFFSNH